MYGEVLLALLGDLGDLTGDLLSDLSGEKLCDDISGELSIIFFF
jgi:hypothetical protein